jgi:hypothetical protein
LTLAISDGVKLDRNHDNLPLQMNAQVRFTGMLTAAVSEASVKVLFFYEGQLIGTAKRCIAAAGTHARVAIEATDPCRITQPLPQSTVDLTVSLTLLRDGTLEWHLSSRATSVDITKQSLRTSLPDTRQFAADLMRDLKTQKHRGRGARNILESTGQHIAKLFPQQFFDLLQDVHASVKRPPTLLLLTNENYVPWELAYLHKPLDSTAPSPFLASQTQMGRWLEEDGVPLPPAIALDVKRISAVAARYGINSHLPELRHAIAKQKALSEWGAKELKAENLEMQALISGNKIPGHLVHFAVHGYGDPIANNAVLLLADKEELPASALTGAHSQGETPRFSFVFLNACQVGSPGRTLGQVGGFQGVLVRGGARGFIAPLWDVDSTVACHQAQKFYSAVFDCHQPVGAVLRALRYAYDDGSTTPMAYIYYGHPALRLKLDPNLRRRLWRPEQSSTAGQLKSLLLLAVTRLWPQG